MPEHSYVSKMQDMSSENSGRQLDQQRIVEVMMIGYEGVISVLEEARASPCHGLRCRALNNSPEFQLIKRFTAKPLA